MAAILEVNESMKKNFLQFEPAPRRGEPEVRSVSSFAKRKCGRFSIQGVAAPIAQTADYLAMQVSLMLANYQLVCA